MTRLKIGWDFLHSELTFPKYDFQEFPSRLPSKSSHWLQAWQDLTTLIISLYTGIDFVIVLRYVVYLLWKRESPTPKRIASFWLSSIAFEYFWHSWNSLAKADFVHKNVSSQEVLTKENFKDWQQYREQYEYFQYFLLTWQSPEMETFSTFFLWLNISQCKTKNLCKCILRCFWHSTQKTVPKKTKGHTNKRLNWNEKKNAFRVYIKMRKVTGHRVFQWGP
jgi:hypothetical protein